MALESMARTTRVTDPCEIREAVQEAYRTTGYLLDREQNSALLVDARCTDCPIVGATPGFCELTGYSLENVIGQNCRLLLQGVPQTAISKSTRKNIQDFCSMCQVAEVSAMPQIASMQANARADGSHFVNFFLIGLCRIRSQDFILGVQMHVGEGLFVRLSQDETTRAVENARTIFKRIRAHLCNSSTKGEEKDAGGVSDALPSHTRHAIVSQPDFAFFCERLQDHCLLLNNGYTAMRREPQELAFQCIVFGNKPVRRTRLGIRFTVHVDEITHSFIGLPLLGFTKRPPKDEADLYPAIGRCVGASVMVGGCGEAFARDKLEHFTMGFRPPPQSEIQSWALMPDVPPQQRKPPVRLERGDMLHCRYLWEGRLQLFRNGNLILDFDVERPIDRNADYYAVVDVCLAAYSLTLMPSEVEVSYFGLIEEDLPQETSLISEGELDEADEAETQEGNAETKGNDAGAPSGELEMSTSGTLPMQVSCDSTASSPASSTESSNIGNAIDSQKIDKNVSAIVNEVLVQQGIKKAVAECKFMVTIADPRGKDCPLIAVSEEFETMTGFVRSEILGVNCRFLNHGCEMDPSDLAQLRVASETGEPFTAVLVNRKKSGELFLNLLDLRGLTVATNPETDEDLWFLIGIQADVTDLATDEMPKDHLEDLQRVADTIRAGIAEELSCMAMTAGAQTNSRDEQPLSRGASIESLGWCLLVEPKWREGDSMGRRYLEGKPSDALLDPPQGNARDEAAAVEALQTGVGSVELKTGPRPSDGLEVELTAGSPPEALGSRPRLRGSELALIAGALALGGAMLVTRRRGLRG